MSKFYTDINGHQFSIIEKEIPCTNLYLYANLFDDFKSVLMPLVNKKTKKMLQDLSFAIHSQIPHLECDEIIGAYIVEEGYNCK
jgi:hypothetical protein